MVTPSRALAIAAATVAASMTAAGAAHAQAAANGEQLFVQNCSACHQKNGLGVPGAFPALAGDAFAQGEPDRVAGLLLHGRGGMPSFSGDLSDVQIATVLTYVRSAWGNHAAPIAVATVAKVRAGAATGEKSVLPVH